MISIDSRMEILAPVVPAFAEWQVKNEPMLFNCDMDHAMKLGGHITRAVLGLLPEGWLFSELVVDSRVHMLMPGWYPCIPGWHHDDVPRTREDKQPNYGAGQDRSEHIACLVNGGICPTAFALGHAHFNEPEIGQTVYAEWHKSVETLLEWGKLDKVFAPSNRLVHFTDRTWHAGTMACAVGWRFFLRASRYRNASGEPIPRGNPRTNEVRRQVQVYMRDPNAGW